MAQIHLTEGPVGAGKTTFGAKLCMKHGCIALTLDDWMVRLFAPARPGENLMQW